MFSGVSVLTNLVTLLELETYFERNKNLSLNDVKHVVNINLKSFILYTTDNQFASLSY